ncbi:hypothetical protein [Methanoregula sp.]|uniref:hypothetical protein n=1 Tax=Methanoregula sp. TaxID=2052170 RepID=UPI00356384A4
MDFAFSLEPVDSGIQPVRFHTEKGKERKEDMSSLEHFFSALALLDTEALFDTSVVFLNIPAKILKGLPVGFSGIKDIGIRVFGSELDDETFMCS